MSASDQIEAGSLRWPESGPPRFVTERDPRSRMLTAMAISLNEHGYENTTVADVVRIAKASRRTFYEHFEDRAQCLFALGDEMTGYLLEVVARTVAQAQVASWPERIEIGLAAHLDAIAANPGLTRSFMLEIFGMGADGLRLRRKAVRRWAQQLADLVEAYRSDFPQGNSLTEPTAIAIVGGIWELSLLAAEEDRSDDIDEIRQVAAQLITDTITAPRSL